MEQIIEKNVRFCGCCHRELPVDSFYVDKRTLAPDNYCKECRRAMSNARYRRSLPASNPLRYPVITEISDCTSYVSYSECFEGSARKRAPQAETPMRSR